MTGKRPRLYPDHQHQWAERCQSCAHLAQNHDAWECWTSSNDEQEIDWLNPDGSDRCPCSRYEASDQVTCTVCGFTVPRNLANLDGTPAHAPVTDQGVAT